MKEKPENIAKMLRGMEKIFDALGNYSLAIAAVEEKDAAYRDFLKKTKENQNYILEVVKELPDEISKDFMDILLRSVFLSSRSNTFSDLSPDQKKSFGKEAMAISQKTKSVIKALEKLKKR